MGAPNVNLYHSCPAVTCVPSVTFPLSRTSGMFPVTGPCAKSPLEEATSENVRLSRSEASGASLWGSIPGCWCQRAVAHTNPERSVFRSCPWKRRLRNMCGYPVRRRRTHCGKLPRSEFGASTEFRVNRPASHVFRRRCWSSGSKAVRWLAGVPFSPDSGRISAASPDVENSWTSDKFPQVCVTG